MREFVSRTINAPRAHRFTALALEGYGDALFGWFSYPWLQIISRTAKILHRFRALLVAQELGGTVLPTCRYCPSTRRQGDDCAVPAAPTAASRAPAQWHSLLIPSRRD